MTFYEPKENLKGKTIYLDLRIKDQITEMILAQNTIAILTQKGANICLVENALLNSPARIWFDKFSKRYNSFNLVKQEDLTQNEEESNLLTLNSPLVFPKNYKEIKINQDSSIGEIIPKFI